MKPYTKTERNLIYRTALKRLEAQFPPFSLCCCLMESICVLYLKSLIDHNTEILLDSLPEFANYKHPEINSKQYWWPTDDRYIRIKVLKECIEQTNS